MAYLTYRPSARRIDDYNTWAHYTSLHLDPVTTTALAGNQAPLLRKYDEGERDRHRIDLLLQIVPSEKLGGTINAAGSPAGDVLVGRRRYHDRAVRASQHRRGLRS